MILRVKRWLSCLIILSMSMMITTHAAQKQEKAWELEAQEVVITNKYTNDLVTMVKGSMRGILISSVDIELSNEGLGVGGIYADILCHKPMSSIRMTLILQKWNDDQENWQAVNRQEFEWSADKLAEGESLTMASISYNIAGLQSGETYRVRGIFGAYDLDGTYNEAWNAYTDGLEF